MLTSETAIVVLSGLAALMMRVTMPPISIRPRFQSAGVSVAWAADGRAASRARAAAAIVTTGERMRLQFSEGLKPVSATILWMPPSSPSASFHPSSGLGWKMCLAAAGRTTQELRSSSDSSWPGAHPE